LTEWLAMSAVNDRVLWIASSSRWSTSGTSQVRIGSMGGHKGLGLRRNRCKDTFLMKALAIATSSVRSSFEARATNLRHISKRFHSALSDPLPFDDGSICKQLQFVASVRTERSCVVEHLGRDRGFDSDPHEERHGTVGEVELSCQASMSVEAEIGLDPAPQLVMLRCLLPVCSLRILQDTDCWKVYFPSLLEAVLAVDSRRTFIRMVSMGAWFRLSRDQLLSTHSLRKEIWQSRAGVTSRCSKVPESGSGYVSDSR
jgi:hypothetical protein